MAGVAAVGVAGAIATGPGMVDDAWISWRYAEHAAHGLGFVYNAGEPPVEGFSNPAWTALLAVAAALGLPAGPAMIGLGLVGAATAPAGVVALARALGADLRAATLAGLALAASPHFAVTAGNGLESGLWVAAVLWAGVAAVAAPTPAAAVVLGALGAVRLEGVGIALLWLIGRPRGDRARVGAGWALGAGLLTGWRLATYGRLVPNTWTAKLARTLADQVAFDVAFLRPDAVVWLVFALALALTPLIFRRDPRSWAAWLVALAIAATAFRVDMWMPGGRLLQPTCAVALALIAQAVSGRRIAWALLLWTLALPFTSAGRRPLIYDPRNTIAPGNPAACAGEWLAVHAPAGAWLATRDAGVLASEVGVGVRVAELHERALTQPHPGGRDADWRAYTPSDPAFVATTVQRIDAGATPYGSDRALLLSLRAPYRYLGRIEQHYHRYYDLYARADVPLPDLPARCVVNFDGPVPAPGDRPFPTLPSDRRAR
jgi:hypothetical protein